MGLSGRSRPVPSSVVGLFLYYAREPLGVGGSPLPRAAAMFRSNRVLPCSAAPHVRSARQHASSARPHACPAVALLRSAGLLDRLAGRTVASADPRHAIAQPHACSASPVVSSAARCGRSNSFLFLIVRLAVDSAPMSLRSAAVTQCSARQHGPSAAMTPSSAGPTTWSARAHHRFERAALHSAAASLRSARRHRCFYRTHTSAARPRLRPAPPHSCSAAAFASTNTQSVAPNRTAMPARARIGTPDAFAPHDQSQVGQRAGDLNSNSPSGARPPPGRCAKGGSYGSTGT